VPPAVSSVHLDDAIDGESGATTSYGRILRSSALIGIATVASVVVGIVRAKAIAVLLGPAGFGLMGTLQAIADLTRSVAEIGINSSGVRQIAEAASSGDAERLVRTATVLRRIALLLGSLGAALLFVCAVPVASFSFGTADFAGAVALLSLAVFLRLVSDGQGALIQGLRRIGDLARATVLASILGTSLAIPLVWMFGLDGVAPALIAIAAASLVCTWWYARKAGVASVQLGVGAMRGEARGLLRLGLAFMASGLLMTGAAYAGRIIVLDEIGLDAVGLYQAAWTVGGLYVGFVLQAMSSDFYPRLVGKIDDHDACRRLVNEQAHASLLLAIPGVIATLALAPLVLAILYTPAFAAAAETLRWLSLGMALRVVTWPMGYVIVAKGAQTLFFVTESIWALFNVASTWVLVRALGLPGIGVAFLLSYLLHYAIVYPVVRRMIGFRWTTPCLLTGLVMLVLCATLLIASFVFPEPWASALGALVAAGAGLWSARQLVVLVPSARIPAPLRRVLAAGGVRVGEPSRSDG